MKVYIKILNKLIDKFYNFKQKKIFFDIMKLYNLIMYITTIK